MLEKLSFWPHSPYEEMKLMMTMIMMMGKMEFAIQINKKTDPFGDYFFCKKFHVLFILLQAS